MIRRSALSETARAFKEWFGIPKASARVLEILYAAGGETVEYEDFSAQLGITKIATSMAVYRMTDALARDAIRAIWTRGYHLTPIGLADCRNALADATERGVITPRRFEEEKSWLGWRALAMRAFGLRPAEAYALTMLMRAPGRMVSMAALQAYDGDGLPSCKGGSGSREGVKRRVQRLRCKLADVGISDAITNIDNGGGTPLVGFTISQAKAADIEVALRYACGVRMEIAA